jgi:hypothetical protein
MRNGAIPGYFKTNGNVFTLEFYGGTGTGNLVIKNNVFDGITNDPGVPNDSGKYVRKLAIYFEGNNFDGSKIFIQDNDFFGYNVTAVYAPGPTTITGNEFSDNLTHVWLYNAGTGIPAGAIESIFASNTFDKATFFDGGSRIYSSIQAAIAAAADGDTIEVAAGTYVETAQIVIDKNLTIIGENKATTTIKPAQSTGSGGDARGWFLVQSGKEFNLSNVTLDGDGKEIYQAIRSHGTGTIENNIIQNIIYPGYQGVGVVAMGGNMIIRANKLENIGRIGIMAFGSGVTDAQITGNTYTGKGEGDHLDYGIEIGGGAKATITGNTISNCLGVASGTWGSAAILVTDHYGPKSTATIIDNDLTDNEFGISIGYSGTDTSIVAIATGNKFTRNLFPISARNTTNIDMAAAFAENTFDKAVMIQGDTVIYSSIQSAINWANAGDTILVGPGTYEEALLLNKKGITVQGADPDNPPVIKGELTIDHTGATTIRGIDFEVQNILHDSIYIKKGNGITIEDCKFDGGGRETITGRRGIQAASDVSNVTVERCTFTNGYDISIQGNMSDLTVKNSTFTDVKSGINQQGGGGLVVEDCYFKNKPFNDGNSYGVRYTAVGGKSLSITRSTFEIDLEGAPDPGSGKYHGSIILRGSNADTTSVKDNTILGGVWNASTAATLNASPNWWGSPCGPSRVHGTATYAPWYADEAMTILRSENVSGEYTFPSGTSHEEINAVVACAAPGSTLIFDGTYEASIWVHEDREDLTFLLKDGTVLQGYEEKGYLFYVDADYITIMGESYGGAKLVPINNWHAVNVGCGYPQGGVTNFILDGLEIDGAYLGKGKAGIGVYLCSINKDVQILNNYIHDLYWDDTELNYAIDNASGSFSGVFDVQGNLFKNTGGIMDEIGDGINAKFNSWGEYTVIEDMVDAGGFGPVAFEPWTHVELFVEYLGGTPWVDRVVSNNDMEVTYAVKADMVEIVGAEFLLPIPDDLEIVEFEAKGTFDWELIEKVAGGIFYVGAHLDMGGEISDPIENEGIVLFTVTLKTDKPGKYTLKVDETTAEFAMRPVDNGVPGGPSTWVYLDEAHPATLNAFELPTIAIVPVPGQDYVVTLPIEFNITVDNSDGGDFENLGLVFTLPPGAVLEYTDDGGLTWKPVVSTFDPGDLAAGGIAFDPELVLFRVTFIEAGDNTIYVALNDYDPTPPFELANTQYTFPTSGVSVIGTFWMQGRTYRGDIPVTVEPYPETKTINRISNNLVIVNVNGGMYLVTTLQERYLNVHAELGKTINVNNGNYLIPTLELKGGNAYWKKGDGTLDNVIDISDAGLVGGAYGGAGSTEPTGENNPDVNFDGKVNILDLALVGGNFGLTSETAYAGWTP